MGFENATGGLSAADMAAVMRGGSGGGWGNDARYCRVSYCYCYTPMRHNDDVGFRLVMCP